MTHEERVYYHLYDKPENPSGNAELIASLEELVLDLYGQLLNAYDPKELDGFSDRMAELGVTE